MKKPNATVIISVCLIAVLACAVFLYGKLINLYTPEKHLSAATASDDYKVEAPDFSVLDMDGNKVTMSEITKGKKAVLNFWATWCDYCADEMPDFDDVYKEYDGEVVFMMVNLTDGQRETVDKAKAFIEKKGYSFPVYFDTENEVHQWYDVSGLPSTYIINSDGTFFGFTQGRLHGDALKEAIDNAS